MCGSDTCRISRGLSLREYLTVPQEDTGLAGQLPLTNSLSAIEPETCEAASLNGFTLIYSRVVLEMSESGKGQTTTGHPGNQRNVD